LRRTVFPDDDQPHARRLFADLASALIYAVAFAGVMDTVLNKPISAVVATSGVLAIVLGLAIQNTLADVFSGLAINIERPFGAGDWITLNGGVEGQVVEINWRASRVRTAANTLVVIPNSIAAKAIVTNHSRLRDPVVCAIRIGIDHKVPPARVIDALQIAACRSAGLASGTRPQACACAFFDALITYELTFAVDDFLKTAGVQSVVIGHVADAFRGLGIQIGSPWMERPIIHDGSAADSGNNVPGAPA
jgi:small-conductance mechanosensitive channel